MSSMNGIDFEDKFVYVDSAVGGVQHRNQVKNLRDWSPPSGKLGVYTTWLRYTEDLAVYAAATPNRRTGEPPSVAGYTGEALATFIPFDFDDDADPSRAQAACMQLLDMLVDTYGVELDVVRVDFSGQKGFSVEVPASLFGGPFTGPCQSLAKRVGRIALRLLSEANAVADTSIYEPLRLWRVSQSRHPKSKLYKTRLSIEDVRSLSIDQIRTLAALPSNTDPPELRDPSRNARLAALWEEAATASVLKDTTVPPLPEQLAKGQRHSSLRTLAARLRKEGLTGEEIFAALVATNESRSDDAEGMTQAELRSIAEWFADKEPGGERPAELVSKASTASAQGDHVTQHDHLHQLGHVDHLAPESLVIVSTVQSQPVRTLWPGRIYLGKLNVLDGDPGLGKSTLTLEIAARVSSGRSLPYSNGSDLDRPAGVVILSAEDDIADTIRPRLEAAGADLGKIAVLQYVRDQSGNRMPTLGDLAAIEAAIERMQASLVIIDPVMAFMGTGVDSHRDQDVRSLFAPLAQLAARRGVAVVIVRHLNKASGGNPLYRGGGSIGIIGAARSGLLVAKDPDNEERRILVSTKNNLSAPAPALAFFIRANDAGIAEVVWDGETQHGAAELLSTPSDADEASALSEGKCFLRDILANGPLSATDVEREATKAGITRSTLRRAKTALQIRSAKEAGRGGAWVWMLPAPKPPERGEQDEQGEQGDRARGDDHLTSVAPPMPQQQQRVHDHRGDHPLPAAVTKSSSGEGDHSAQPEHYDHLEHLEHRTSAAPARVKDADRRATPPEVFDPLDEEFGFTLDACAEAATATCARYLTAEQDGLAQDWSGEVVWLNPPDSEVADWLAKAWQSARQGATVVAVVKHDPAAKWWGMWVRGVAEVRELETRVASLGPDGTPHGCANSLSAVVIYRPVPAAKALPEEAVRAATLALVARTGFDREVDVSPGVRAGPGEASWRAWVAQASRGALTSMRMMLEASA